MRFEIVPGGHLGMLTGRRARTRTWPLLDAWIDGWTESEEPAPRPRRTAPPAGKAPAKKAAAKKTGARKAPTKKTPSKKAAPKKTAAKRTVKKTAARTPTDAAPGVETVADPAAIGVNPQRRYGSADSRALRR